MDFYEEQRVDVLWLKIFMGVISMGAIVGLIIGMTTQEGAQDLGFYIGMIVTIMVLAFSYWMVFFTVLKTSISSQGFTYVYFPMVINEVTILPEQIKSWRMERISNKMKYGGFGIRKSYFPKQTAFMMGGSDTLTFELQNGRTYIFTTRHPENMRVALQKYFSPLEKR
jgi:hypothetical protein